MDPLTGAAIAAPIVGGIIGGQQSSRDARRAREQMEAALAELAGLNIPGIDEQMLSLLSEQYVGDLNPISEQYAGGYESALGDISLDPQFLDNQLLSMEGLKEYAEGGLNEGDRAGLRISQREAQGANQAKQAQILQEMAQRGVGGSGMELAARLSANQNASQMQSEQNDRIAMMASDRAYDANSRLGDTASKLRAQSFGEQKDIGSAKDIAKQFTLNQQQSYFQRQAQAANQSALRNLDERQRLAGAEAATRNAEQQANKSLLQQRFQNQYNVATAKNAARTGTANLYNQQAGRTADAWAAGGRGVGSGIAGYQQSLRKPTISTGGISSDGYDMMDNDEETNRRLGIV